MVFFDPDFLIQLLASQSPTTALAIMGVILIYQIKRFGKDLNLIQKSIMVLNHNSDVIIKVLLHKGMIKPEELKDVNLA